MCNDYPPDIACAGEDVRITKLAVVGVCNDGAAASCTTDADCGTGVSCDLTQAGGCEYLGDTATVRLRAEITNVSFARFDIGIYLLAADAGTVTCYSDYLPISPTGDLDQDTCGDIPREATVALDLGEVTLDCTDAIADGVVDVSATITWKTLSSAQCGGVGDTVPTTPSRCWVAKVPVGGLLVPDCYQTCADDANPCTDTLCVGTSCTHPNDDTNTCSDDRSCTDEVCSAGACVPTPHHERCADASFCNGTEACDPATSTVASGCVAGSAPDCRALDGACTHGVCEERTDTFGCVASPVNEGLGCDDDDGCTSFDTCAGGQCVGATYQPDNTCFLPGTCAAANQASSCSGGVITPCQTGTPGTESCNGVDDDCDGVVDDGPIPADNVAGACSNNVKVCQWPIGYVDAAQNYVPSAETCNGLDDNCDGSVDESDDGDACTQDSCDLGMEMFRHIDLTPAECQGGGQVLWGSMWVPGPSGSTLRAFRCVVATAGGTPTCDVTNGVLTDYPPLCQ